jgi:glycosyltransferase involved in cell wall biosynthesis
VTILKKPSKTFDKPNVLVIGPTPPPFGGVATFVENFMSQKLITEEYALKLFRTGMHDKKGRFFIQAAKEMTYFVRFFFSRQKFSLYHVHTASYWSFLRNAPYILLVKHLKAGKVITHIHGAKFHIFYNQSNSLKKRFIRFILNSSDSLIVTSPSWIEVINYICGRCNRIYAVPNGYDKNVFHVISKSAARKKLNLSLDKKILLNIGHLEEYKGQSYLIEGMSEVIKHKKDVNLYIIGNGSLHKALLNQIRGLNLENHVFLIDAGKPIDEIVAWLNASDIFVLPSLNEGNPTVMFEALGVGLPFIGTRVGGIPDVIISDDYGLLCEPADSDDLATAILYSLDKKWDRNKIILYANNFTWESISKTILDIYLQS